ncbi:hypothetical protein JD844_017197 [Phrynosoma platyrhinos]|uniref:Protein kinase domain-containing protein n=1 Tax=Phrynosoma platyrhinos TaxID=52577 RepID=A0ABQ7SLF7_PHRPL|nr:hypothetical protein JD844_017197 [Phrynosoma platyrhinos]
MKQRWQQRSHASSHPPASESQEGGRGSSMEWQRLHASSDPPAARRKARRERRRRKRWEEEEAAAAQHFVRGVDQSMFENSNTTPMPKLPVTKPASPHSQSFPGMNLQGQLDWGRGSQPLKNLGKTVGAKVNDFLRRKEPTNHNNVGVTEVNKGAGAALSCAHNMLQEGQHQPEGQAPNDSIPRLNPPPLITKKRTPRALKTTQDMLIASQPLDVKYIQTDGYRAPEAELQNYLSKTGVQGGTECTSAVDLWSLGIVLLEMFSGMKLKHIVQSREWRANNSTIIDHIFASKSVVNSAIPAYHLRDLLKSMLHNDQEKRASAAKALCSPFFSIPFAPHIEDLVMLPTPVLRLLNILSDASHQSEEEFEGQCTVFVEYANAGDSKAAQQALTGKRFDGKFVVATFYPLSAYKRGYLYQTVF